MNSRRIDYYNKLIGKEEDNGLKKYRRDKRSRNHRRIDYYEEILRRNKERELKEEIREIREINR